MARAKQTGRAEARRRYRQANVPDAELEGLEDEAPAPEREPSRRDASRSARQQPQQPARPGFTSAFRAAYRPLHLREDLQALPRLLTHVSFLLPLGLIVVGAIVGTIYFNYTGGRFVFQTLVDPRLGYSIPQLVTGFLAPRASYLLGGLITLAQGIAFIIFVLQPSAPLGPVGPGGVGELLLGMLSYLPVGVLFAAAAAYYRRFLALSGPRRAAAAGGRQPSRSRR